MKKIMLSALMALAVAAGASAKTADELRIYINPGHGGWTPNDRPCNLVNHPGPYSRTNTDTLSFYESNTDLQKGFGLLERLISYGLKFDRTLNQGPDSMIHGAARDMSNNIVMSRVKNGPYFADNGTKNQLGDAYPKNAEVFNRNLSEICAEVEANNFDMFISIHSNALTDLTSTNYPLFLYRGYDDCHEADGNLGADFQKTSRAMADICWPYAYGNKHMGWTAYASSKNLRGDINFYGSSSTVAGCTGYLGVLKHTTPGFLVEGYFHTYAPARHRAMNWDVCYLEGTAYGRGIADYFGLAKEKTGLIYGIVRDANEKFADAWYAPNPATKDIYKPLNDVVVTLKKDGQTVATYTTDGYYNGAFVFEVEPGTYTISCSHPQYLEADDTEVTVVAASDVYPQIFLTNVDYEAPTEVYENYPDPTEGNSAYKAADEYAFKAEYADVEIPELEGKIIRRAIQYRDKMYVLAHDKAYTYAAKLADADKPVPTLLVYDLKNKKVLAEVSTAGTYGTIADVSDIQVSADGILLACNQTKNQYDANYVEKGDEGRGTFYVYKWDNDKNGLPTGDPKQWISHQGTGRWYRSYPGHFTYSGTMEDGLVVIAQPTITAPAYKLRQTNITIANGMSVGASDVTTPNTFGEGDMGADYNFYTAPMADNAYLLIGSGDHGVSMYSMTATDTNPSLAEGSAELNALHAPGQVGMFKYAGTNYMVVPDVTENGVAGVKLVNLTNDISKAALVSTINTSAEAVAGSAAVFGAVEAVYDEFDALSDASIALYMLRNGKLTKFTTKNVAQPVHPAAFAYGLSMDAPQDNVYTINYTLSDDVNAADLVLTPVGEGDEITVPLTGLAKGKNTVDFDGSDLADGAQYTWGIKVANKANPVTGEYRTITNSHNVRGGVVTMNDPQYPESFGRMVIVHGKVIGFDVYEADGTQIGELLHKQSTKIASTFTNQSDPFRGSEYKNLAIFPCWGDKAEGVVALDMANINEEPFSLFNGKNDGTGNHVLDGVKLGGGSAGACVIGEGENTRLYSFSEDHEGGNGKGGTENALVVYNLGNDFRVSAAPTVLPGTGYKSMLANGQADLHPFGNGFFACQNRGAGNNAASVPSFMYIDADTHEILFNSGDDLKNDLPNGGHSFAITPDGKTAVVLSSVSAHVFDVTWEDGIPTMTPTSTFKLGHTYNQYTHMRFDYAGNLHVYSPSNGYHAYALSRDAGTVTTPAKADYVIGSESGVANITADNAEGTPVYYNLSGVRVSGDAIVPGVYVKVLNGQATKVVVK